MWPFKKKPKNPVSDQQPPGAGKGHPKDAGLERMLDAYGIQGAERSALLKSQELDRKAQNLLAAGQWNEVIACSDRSLELRPDGWVALGNKTTALLKLGRSSEALTAVDLALKRNPDQPDLLIQRGTALVDLGRPEEALKSLDRALELKPQSSGAQSAVLFFKAEAYKALGRKAEAARALRQYLEVTPNAGQDVVAAIQAELRKLGAGG